MGQTGQYGCMVDGCPERFATLGALGPHMWRGHSDEWKSDPTLKAAYDALKASEKTAKLKQPVESASANPAALQDESHEPTRQVIGTDPGNDEDGAAVVVGHIEGDTLVIDDAAGYHPAADIEAEVERLAVDNPVETVDNPPAIVTPYEAVQQMRESALEAGLLEVHDPDPLRAELVMWLERLLGCWFVPRALRREATQRLYELTFAAHVDATLERAGDQ